MKKWKRLLAMVLLFVFSMTIPAFAAAPLQKQVGTTAAYLMKQVQEPTVASIGGEWTVIGLARSDAEVPKGYFEKYEKNMTAVVQENKGVLHERKYTEYARVVLALTAMGKDPKNVAGYDLVKPLEDVEKVCFQGLNGPVWALLALDSGEYETAADVRKVYIQKILEQQLADGGWALYATAKQADPDVTGMVLQALAKYQQDAAVKTATEKALICMSEMQEADGGFASGGLKTAESCAQMLVALGELGVSVEDARFVKNGKSVLDALLGYRLADGSFCHTAGGGSNLMATEQAFYAMAAAERTQTGKNSLYRMTDALAQVYVPKGFSYACILTL